MSKRTLITANIVLAIAIVISFIILVNRKSHETAASDWQQTVPEAIRQTPGIGKFETPIDYSEAAYWLARPDSIGKAVDAIYFYPTAYTSQDITQSAIADIDDEGMKTAATANLENAAKVYTESCNLFAPLYRQVDVTYANTLSHEAFTELINFVTDQDPTAAIDYYFEHLNQGRPFIIAGHSQGSQTTLKLLERYFARHQDYLQRMVAAYPVGYSVTGKYLEDNPHLKFAEGATDTGVIVSWNTEGTANSNAKSLVVEPGAMSINPLNWKRDDTYAPASQNLGSRINGKKTEGMADAQINLERGVVVVTTEAAKPYRIPAAMEAIFGPESYHGQDYGFFYYNLQQNVADRIAKWQAEN